MNRRTFCATSAGLIILLAACIQPTPTPNPNTPHIQFTTNPTPLTTGDAELTVLVNDKDGKPLDGAVVTISYRMSSMNMGITSNTAIGAGNGSYRARTSFTHAGRTKFTIQVDAAGLPQSILETELDVR